MDTTEQNIKMCGGTIEVHDLCKKPPLQYGDVYFIEGMDKPLVNPKAWYVWSSNSSGGLYEPVAWNGRIRRRIWLPRQGQLQEISGLTWREFDHECQKYDTDTKEQAGIQVVMDCKFSKIWDGENWVLKRLEKGG